MPPKTNKISAAGKLALERVKKVAEENARIKALQDEEDRKALEEEQRILAEEKRIQDEKNNKIKAKQDKILKQKLDGTYLTPSQKLKAKKNKEKVSKMTFHTNYTNIFRKKCDSESESESDSEIVQETAQETVLTNQEIKVKHNFRSVISVILGHVDTGKTTFLDKLRGTSIQSKEAGGITQHIGATYFPKEYLETKISESDWLINMPINIPGLIIIDTPGHEAFKNLRNRGSSLCDIAIVIIDLVHGLEQQTKESINILKEGNCKFIFVLNKIDRLYGWKTHLELDIKTNIASQNINTIDEFKSRLDKIIVQIMELGLNAKLYWENDSIEDTINIIPISAISGEGIPDLLSNLITYSENYLTSNITISDNFKCTVMESSQINGYGLSIDAILISGKLSQGDKIIISTSSGPVETIVKNILTSPPNNDSRIKSEYIQHKSIDGAIAVKLVANDIDKILSGTPIFKLTDTNISSKQEIIKLTKESINQSQKIKLDNEGIIIHSSTLGSLEALIQFLRYECKPPILISQANIGPITKKDVVKTFISTKRLEKEYNTILGFDVEIDKEAQIEADKCGTKIFTAEIIYHLFDKFIKYKEQLIKIKKDEVRPNTVFPCILKILPNCIYNKKNPLIFGVDILEGNLHLGTPLIIPSTKTFIGKVTSIQNDHKDITIGKKGTSVCIKVENSENPLINYGKQFTHELNLYSKISKESNNLLNTYFKDELLKDDNELLLEMKKIFKI